MSALTDIYDDPPYGSTDNSSFNEKYNDMCFVCKYIGDIETMALKEMQHIIIYKLRQWRVHDMLIEHLDPYLTQIDKSVHWIKGKDLLKMIPSINVDIIEEMYYAIEMDTGFPRIFFEAHQMTKIGPKGKSCWSTCRNLNL